MVLNFIGRGSAFNVKEGNNSAFIKIDNELIMFDCGEGIFERIIKNDLLHNIKNIKIFITHLHSDHTGSLSSLIYYCYYIKYIKVKVYFPNNDLKELLKMHANVDGRDYEYVLLDTNKMTAIGNMAVEPVKVEHINVLKCFGYIVQIKNKLIWYSGDSNRVSDVINKYAIDEFYQDTCLADYEGNVHTSLKVLCQSIPKDKRKNVYCMHIDCDELINKAVEEGFNVVETI